MREGCALTSIYATEKTNLDEAHITGLAGKPTMIIVVTVNGPCRSKPGFKRII